MKLNRLLVAVVGLLAVCCDNTKTEITVTKIINFEDGKTGTQWSKYIDNLQYGGNLLYGGNGYSWQDELTSLSSSLPDYWKDSTLFGGGIAISNYVDNNSDITYEKQLAISVAPKSGENFAVCYVATNLCPPYLEFAEGTGTVKEISICPTAYTDAVVQRGNAFSPALPENGYIRIEATGIDAQGTVTAVASLYLYDGKTFTGWQPWSLSSLGEVKRIEFRMYEGVTESDKRVDSTAEYPVYPNYFALDDILL